MWFSQSTFCGGVNEIQKQFGTGPSDLIRGLRNGSEGWAHYICPIRIIEADDADTSRAGNFQLIQGSQNAQGHPVIEGKDRGRRIRGLKQIQSNSITTLNVRVTLRQGLLKKREACLLHRLSASFHTIDTGGVREFSGDDRYLSMSQLHQVANCVVARFEIIRDNAVYGRFRWDAVNEDQRCAVLAEDFASGIRVSGRQEDSIDSLEAECVQMPRFEVYPIVGVADKHLVAMLDGLVFDTSQGVNKEWISYVLNNESKHVGSSGPQPTRSFIRGEVYGSNRFLNRGCEIGADSPRVVDYRRYG
ncbi:MAG: hypothetical protein P4K94_06230 [Terracidiphilus sp.]|nr:hypothetical protein [Terracidiphilus sp.]